MLKVSQLIVLVFPWNIIAAVFVSLCFNSDKKDLLSFAWSRAGKLSKLPRVQRPNHITNMLADPVCVIFVCTCHHTAKLWPLYMPTDCFNDKLS